jgi:hypothetical protein
MWQCAVRGSMYTGRYERARGESLQGVIRKRLANTNIGNPLEKEVDLTGRDAADTCNFAGMSGTAVLLASAKTS